MLWMASAISATELAARPNVISTATKARFTPAPMAKARS